MGSAGSSSWFGPMAPLPIRRVEKDPAKLQAVYDLGAEAGRASLSGLKEYLLTHE